MTTTIRQKNQERTLAGCVTSPRFVLLGLPATLRRRFSQQPYIACSTLPQIDHATRCANKDSIWISYGTVSIDRLIRVLSRSTKGRDGRGTRLGHLLMLEAPRRTVVAVLHGYFGSVVGSDPSFTRLPADQLAEVLAASREKTRDLFIGGVVDLRSEVVALVRGDLSRVIAPLWIFPPSGAAKPNFRRFAVDDYGQTIRFGGYEASSDAVLYAIDPDYRTRINAQRRQRDKGFGPSLRRLRTLRKIGRDAFEGVAPKTIARIERGEVQKPRGETLRVICEALGVEPDEIETY